VGGVVGRTGIGIGCRWRCLLIGLAALILAGCRSGLPRIDGDRFSRRLPALPADAAPLLSWSATQKGMKTYWHDQDVHLRVRAYIPDSWKQAGDGCWQVDARNQEGTRLPFLGVLHVYTDERGNRKAVLVPEVDLDACPEGLYVVIVPNITVKGGEVASLQPQAAIREIRNHAFQPFAFPIPLIPDSPSLLTPMPYLPDLPPVPPGTPIRVD